VISYFLAKHVTLLHCALSIAAQCIVIAPVCGGQAQGGRSVPVTTIIRNCVHRFPPNLDCRWRCWPSPADYILAVLRPRERGLRRAKIFGSPLLQPARSVCVSLSAFFHL